jgi:hypothetical protein
MADLKALADAIIKGDQNTAVEITKAALDCRHGSNRRTFQKERGVHT